MPLLPSPLPRHVYAVISGTVTTAWALVLVDALHREDWDDVEPVRHFGSALLLFTAAGVAAGALFLALAALAGVVRRAVERRWPKATPFVEPAFGAAVMVALSCSTAFWVFSGER